MPDWKVGSISEALELAEKWKADGSHTWFRGHADINWTLTSTLARLGVDEDAYEATIARLGAFTQWLRRTPSLKHLLEERSRDELFAVAQHYGVATHYIDFTSEPAVAGYFATTGPCATPPGAGCIIAIDPDELVELVTTIADAKQWPRDAWPEKVEVSIAGLWRIQAQHGRFIYLPTTNIEAIYPYDRIVFPHDGRASAINMNEIYPRRQSALEIQLDDFFTAEFLTASRAEFEQYIERLGAAGIDVAQVRAESPVGSQYLAPGTDRHESWGAINPAWTALNSDETWTRPSAAPQVEIALPSDVRAEPIKEAVRSAVLDALVSIPACRTRPLRWRISIGQEECTDCGRRLGRTWDGMRLLPYSDEQLAAALAGTASRNLAPEVVVDGIPLELSNDSGVTARAIVEADRIVAAYRPGLSSLLRNVNDTPRLLLQVVQDPALVFEFDALVDLYATDIIPAQVALDRTDLAIFYSPALALIGIA